MLTIKKSKGIIKHTVEVNGGLRLREWNEVTGDRSLGYLWGFLFSLELSPLELGDGYTVVSCIDILYIIFYKYAFVST